MAFDHLKRKLASLLDRLFQPRELFIRSDGQVRYFQVSVRSQQAAAIAVAAVVGWGLVASGAFFSQGSRVSQQTAEIEEHKTAYYNLLAEVTEYHEQFQQITEDLEANQAHLLAVVNQNDGSGQETTANVTRFTSRAAASIALQGTPNPLSLRLDSFKEDLREIAGRNVGLKGQVVAMQDMLQDTLADRLKASEAKERLGQQLDEVQVQLAGEASARRELEITVANLRSELSAAGETQEAFTGIQDELRREIAELEAQVSTVATQEAALRVEKDSLEQQLTDATNQQQRLANERDVVEMRAARFEQRLADLNQAQEEILARLSDQTEETVDNITKTVALTGIDVQGLIAMVDEGARSQGGPFVGDAALDGSFEGGADLEMALTLLDLKLDRWSALQELMRSLPLTAPLEQYRISSRYGSRRDPVNGRKARHNGMDFGAASGTPIYVTAPGKVVFAGRRGHYGRIVEVDHGHGIRTRYAHMRKILVKAGDLVQNSDKIGLVGSSGRSTGPHVHYEVLFNGVPQDPEKFLMAGKHVFKE